MRYERDFASVEKEEVRLKRDLKKKELERRLKEEYQRDNARWEYMDKEFEQEAAKLKAREDVYKLHSKQNSHIGYNILNFDYQKNRQGQNQRSLD